MSKSLLTMPIKAVPYDHQRKAFEFTCLKFGLLGAEQSSNGVALLMEMGTGKTLTSIAIAGALYKEKKIKKTLIVAPLSILGVWEGEFNKFADFPFDLTVLKGSSAEKAQLVKTSRSNVLQILVVNYESAWRIQKELLDYNADLIIADEGHKLKEPRSQQSKGMHKLGDYAKYKLLLTGTVITNKELDVFSQYRFLNRRIYGDSFFAFRRKYFDMTGYGNHTPVFKKKLQEDFLGKLHSVAYRVTKEECLDLPDVTDEIRYVEIEDKALKLYKKLEKESFAEIGSSEVSAVNVLTKLLRLSQVTGGHLTDDEGDMNLVSTAKLTALADVIDTVMAEGKKLVIMARFVPELNDIQKLLEKKKIGYATGKGSSEYCRL